MVNTHPPLLHLDSFGEEDAIKELLRQTERRIEDQLRFATAADQRAVAFAAVLIVVVGVFAGNQAGSNFEWATVCVLVSLICSICFAVYSAKPTRMYGSGSSSSSLTEYSTPERCGFLLSGIIERNDANIMDNDKALKRSALFFRFSLFFAATGGILVILDLLDIQAVLLLTCKGNSL